MTNGEEPKPDESQGYLTVSLDLLRIDTVTDFDLYLQASGGSYVLYRKRHLPFTSEARERLRKSSVEKVYVPGWQSRECRRYVEEALPSILADDGIEPEKKAEVLYSSLTNLVEDVMAEPRSGDVVPRSKGLVNSTCQFLNREQGFLGYLMQVTSYDYYTYTHSVNVFVFTMAMANQLLPPEEISEDLGVGALLHDIGKSLLDPAIVNHPGKLTDEQFQVMKSHTIQGFDLLNERNELGPVALDMVRHHHERMDGTGYPDGLSAERLPRHARIIKIADIFDALTTKRSYKNAMNSFPALKLMQDEMMPGELDTDLFHSFVKMMGDAPGLQKP